MLKCSFFYELSFIEVKSISKCSILQMYINILLIRKLVPHELMYTNVGISKMCAKIFKLLKEIVPNLGK